MAETLSIKGVYEANTGASSWQALQESLRRFSYNHALEHPVLVTSVRKASTHLVRNFAAHFIGSKRTHWDFIGPQQLISNYDDFTGKIGREHWLHTGHVNRN